MNRLRLKGGVAVLLALVGLGLAAPAPGVAISRLRVPIPADDGTLTPYTFTVAYPLMTLVYDTLYVRGGARGPTGAAGAAGSQRAVRPWLVRRLRRADMGRRLTITLRRGTRWHDGRRLTARDVAFTYRYFARRYHPRFTPQLRAIARVSAPDATTVVFRLRYSSPGFLNQPLADVPILPRHLWTGLPAGALAPGGLPIGSGPYRLVAHRTGERYRFRAVRGYFLGRPRVDTIDVPILPSFSRMVRALRNRDIDAIPVSLPPSEQEDLRDDAFKTQTGSLYTPTTLMFNLRRKPFDRPAARRAVADALDLLRLSDSVEIDGIPADRGILHPESGWGTEGAVQRYRPARARRELARLRLPAIDILAPDNDPVRSEAGRQVVLALERAGGRARLRRLSPQRLAAAVGQDATTPTFQAAIWSTPALTSHDPDFLRAVFGSRAAPLNYSGYRSAAFDRLAERVARETNRRRRSADVKSQIDLLARDAPVIPLFFQKGAFVYRSEIYDRWVYVDGAGMLDKLSFLPGALPSPGDRAEPPPSQRSGGADRGIGTMGYVALGLFVAIVLYFVIGVRARRRR